MIEINAVSKRFGSTEALKNVSFNVGAGEIVGFLGPNGAGKSTMMKIITGFLSADSGTVNINGVTVAQGKTKHLLSVGYLPENNPLYPDMIVREYLEYAVGFYPAQTINPGRIDEIISITGLERVVSKLSGSLSKGYRQRLGLAQAILHNPDVLILDEPTTGLDPNQILEVRRLILELGQSKTILLSTHIMQEVKALCSRTIIMHNGILVADSSAGETFENPITEIELQLLHPASVGDLQKIKGVTAVEPMPQNRFVIKTREPELRPAIFEACVAMQNPILLLNKKEQSLEAVFRELTTS